MKILRTAALTMVSGNFSLEKKLDVLLVNAITPYDCR